jgi:isoquinoline 1-oxidoreductase beta subunit
VSVARIDRREFLAGLGIAAGGLTLGVRLSFADEPEPAAAADFSPNAFVSIAASGAVTVIAHRSEMGQGVRTALPMIVADELEADWSRVTVVQAPGDKIYGNQNTDGSRSVRNFLGPLRLAGATARAMLIAAAAKKWRVPASRLVAAKHQITDPRRDRSVGYGELVAAAAALPVPTPDKVKLKDRAAMRLIGTSEPIVDGRDITTGAAVYGADVRRPGMLTAVIERPPAVGDEVAAVDDEAARAIPGVRDVIQLPVAGLGSGFAPLGGVAVVAGDTWAAIRGRRALEITWRPGPNRGYESKAFRAQLEKAAASATHVARKQGDAVAALERASTRVEATYYVPHLAQAPMEPPCAVAEVKGDRCEVWAPVQTPQRTRAEVAGALGLDESAVTVNVTLLGGGFGRKSKPDFAVEAALLSARVKAPVRVQWTRADDLRHGYFHSVSAQQLTAGIDRGVVIAWRHRSAFPPIAATFQAGAKQGGAGELGQGLADVPFAIGDILIENGEAEAHLRIGWMRSVANIYHAFAVGSFVDEIATELERDPKQMWLELLGPDRALDPAKIGMARPWNYGESTAAHHIDTGRLRRVIEAACAKSGWDNRGDRPMGLSAHRSFSSYVATVIEVDPALRPVRVWTAIDCGMIVHRDRVRSQLEGGVIYGLSAALHGEITARDGAVEQGNFDTYRVLRMNESPRSIEVELIDSDSPPGGVGEPGTPPVAAAFANAVFAATGYRVREMPMHRSLVKYRR